MCDFDGVYGIVRTHLASQDHPHPLSVFYGAEILVQCPVPEHFKADRYAADMWSAPLQKAPVFLQNRVAFFASSKKSYTQLCELLSYVHRNGKIATALDLNDPHIHWPTEAVVIWPMRGLQQLFSPRQNGIFNTWSHCVRNLAERYSNTFYLALTPPSSPF